MHLILFLPLLILGQKPVDAEQMFRAMEKKVAEAKSLKVVSNIFVDAKGTVKGQMTLYLGEGGRLRLESSHEPEKKKAQEVVVISDGKRLAINDKVKKPILRDTPDDLRVKCLGLLMRTACSTLVDELSRPGSQPPLKDLTLSAFTLGDKVMIGNRKAQIVAYQVARKGVPEPLHCKVWIDLETGLPLHRTLSIVAIGVDYGYGEEFVEFVLDAKIDGKLFELPQ